MEEDQDFPPHDPSRQMVGVEVPLISYPKFTMGHPFYPFGHDSLMRKMVGMDEFRSFKQTTSSFKQDETYMASSGQEKPKPAVPEFDIDEGADEQHMLSACHELLQIDDDKETWFDMVKMLMCSSILKWNMEGPRKYGETYLEYGTAEYERWEKCNAAALRQVTADLLKKVFDK